MHFLLEMVGAFTATITWQCNSIAGAALRKELKERERARERGGERERERRFPPPTHFLAHRVPISLSSWKQGGVSWRSCCPHCYSVPGYQLPSRQSQKIKEGKELSKLSAIPVILQLLTSFPNLLAIVYFSECSHSCFFTLSGVVS